MPIVDQGAHLRRHRRPARAARRADDPRRPSARAEGRPAAPWRRPGGARAPRCGDRDAPRRASRRGAPPCPTSPIRPSCRSAPAARTCARRSREHQVVVVAGETGSGKTTQLPKICLELGRGVRGAIGHTQPRRLAARTVAERIADELDVSLGEAVGYSVRFNDRSGQDTLVRLMTDGLLLAETSGDPLLRRYDTIIVDEAHERSLNIDFLLGYLKRILPRAAGPEAHHHVRDDRPRPLRRALRRRAGRRGVGPHVPRRGPPPAGRGGEPTRSRRSATPWRSCTREGPGDVLVFLSGEREIRDTADGLRGRLAERRRDPAALRAPVDATSSTASSGARAARTAAASCWRRTSPRRR